MNDLTTLDGCWKALSKLRRDCLEGRLSVPDFWCEVQVVNDAALGILAALTS